MLTSCRVLALVLLLCWCRTAAYAEVWVRWDLDRVPSRESLDVSTLVIPASKPAAVRDAVAKGFRVYLDVAATSLSEVEATADVASGAVVRGGVNAQQLDELRKRLRAPGARVLPIDERGLWPHIRLNPVALRNNVLQVASRSAQPWMDSNAVFVRITPSPTDGTPLLLSPGWEPTTAADQDQEVEEALDALRRLRETFNEAGPDDLRELISGLVVRIKLEFTHKQDGKLTRNTCTGGEILVRPDAGLGSLLLQNAATPSLRPWRPADRTRTPGRRTPSSGCR